jgi:type VI protein secretion system component VasK
MASDQQKQAVRRDPGEGALRWLGIGGAAAIVLALLAILLAWQRASDERRAAEDVRARVAAEMNRIEAEAQRIEREASK